MNDEKAAQGQETHFSRPSPTAMIRLLSPSHERSFLEDRCGLDNGNGRLKPTMLRTSCHQGPYIRPSEPDLLPLYPIS